MKILMVNTEMNRGGAAKMAATLVSAVNHHEDDTQAMLAHCENNKINGAYHGFKRPLAYYINILQARLFGTQNITDFGVANDILKMADKVDIIHIHNLHGYYLNFVKLIKGLSGKPIIWTWHDMWGATGRCGFSMGCSHWKTGCLKCQYMNYYPKAWIDNAKQDYKNKTNILISLKNLYIVFPSAWLRQIAVERGYHEKRMYVIPNPVDLSKYRSLDKKMARKKLDLPDRDIALFVAHNCNDERKRYKDFEKLVLNLGIQGVVAGIEPDDKNPAIIYLGRLSSAIQLAYAYSAADIFIITSQIDNYPNTVIEAMACGTPVFGYAVGGIPSQLPNDWDGLVEYKDMEGLGKKISNYLLNKNPNIKKKMVGFADSNWDPGSIAGQYIHLYKEIMHN